MDHRPVAVIAAALLAVGCGGTEPSGTISLTVDAVAPLTRQNSIIISGNVTRTPASNLSIVVSASGGAQPAADTTAAARFEVRVNLNQNADNQITLSATDVTGSTSGTQAVSVRHDNQAPAVSQVIPGDVADNVDRSTVVEITFTEPVVVGSGGGVHLSRQGVTVPGANVVSADSLKVTFTPAAQLAPNVAYGVALSSVNDPAANMVVSTFASCFVTSPAGASAMTDFSDPVDDLYATENEPSTTLPDLIAARLTRDESIVSALFRFSGPRSHSRTAQNRGHVYLDLDVDQDSLTGNTTLKDEFFSSLGPEYSSGTGAEFIASLEPIEDFDDNSFVGRYSDFTVLALFVPAVCGPFMGFSFPLTLFGDEDGLMNAVILGASFQGDTAAFFDPFPEQGHLTIDLRAPVMAPAPLLPLTAPTKFRRFRPRLHPRLP